MQKNECNHLLEGDKRKECREMVIDQNNPAKLAMETKQPMRQNEDDQAFLPQCAFAIAGGCVVKMSDLGEKLGCTEKSQTHIDCCLS